jgi:group I intron endonuclease
MKSGIYIITNKVNGKRYIGSSYNAKRRQVIHRYYLNRNKHQNQHLQRAWNIYGPQSFEFAVVEEALTERLLEIEQKYLDEAKLNQDEYYNICFDASSVFLGRKHTEETKRKMSEKKKGLCKTEKHKQHMSEALRGAKNPNFGKHFSEEHRRKISESMKGKQNRLVRQSAYSVAFLSETPK